jgi:hypothetical protein
MATGDFRDGVWPTQDKLRLWYKTKAGNRPGLTKGEAHLKDRGEWSQWDTELEEEEEHAGGAFPSSKLNDDRDEEEIITEIDVLFGDARPFWGFERVKNGPVVERKPNKWETVDIVVRKGNPSESSSFLDQVDINRSSSHRGGCFTATPLASPPRFNEQGKFKIMQIADLHFSVSHGECRDTPKTPCVGDVDTLELLGKMLDREKPDLVVFTGDQLNGQESSWDARSVIAKVTGPVVDRKIPWTAIFGERRFGDS